MTNVKLFPPRGCHILDTCFCFKTSEINLLLFFLSFSDDKSIKENYVLMKENMKFHLVTEKWVSDSIENGRPLDESDYESVCKEEYSEEDSEDLLL